MFLEDFYDTSIKEYEALDTWRLSSMARDYKFDDSDYEPPPTMKDAKGNVCGPGFWKTVSQTLSRHHDTPQYIFCALNLFCTDFSDHSLPTSIIVKHISTHCSCWNFTRSRDSCYSQRHCGSARNWRSGRSHATTALVSFGRGMSLINIGRYLTPVIHTGNYFFRKALSLPFLVLYPQLS